MASDGDQRLGDTEFRAAFSLLPHVLRLTKTLSTGKAHQQLLLKTVSELQAQAQRCHQLLETCPALNCTLDEQRALLVKKKQQLRHQSELLLKYKELDILSANMVHR